MFLITNFNIKLEIFWVDKPNWIRINNYICRGVEGEGGYLRGILLFHTDDANSVFFEKSISVNDQIYKQNSKQIKKKKELEDDSAQNKKKDGKIQYLYGLDRSVSAPDIFCNQQQTKNQKKLKQNHKQKQDSETETRTKLIKKEERRKKKINDTVPRQS